MGGEPDLAQKDSKGFTTSRDIPDDVWEANAKGWRAALERQVQADMAQGDTYRRAAEPVVGRDVGRARRGVHARPGG